MQFIYSLIAPFLENIRNHAASALIVIALVLGGCGYGFFDYLRLGFTQNAYNIIAYGLKDCPTDQCVYTTIKKWKHDDWGAQIGSIETMCQIYKSRLLNLMSYKTMIYACKTSK